MNVSQQYTVHTVLETTQYMLLLWGVKASGLSLRVIIVSESVHMATGIAAYSHAIHTPFKWYGVGI